MAVPAHDQLDWLFAKHFHLPIRSILAGISAENQAYEAKDGILTDSGVLTGLPVPEAIARIRELLAQDGKGQPALMPPARCGLLSAALLGERPIIWRDAIPYPVRWKSYPSPPRP